MIKNLYYAWLDDKLFGIFDNEEAAKFHFPSLWYDGKEPPCFWYDGIDPPYIVKTEVDTEHWYTLAILYVFYKGHDETVLNEINNYTILEQ